MDWGNVQLARAHSASPSGEVEAPAPVDKPWTTACNIMAYYMRSFPAKEIGTALKDSPTIAIVPTLKFTAMVALAVYGILIAAAGYVSTEQQFAQSVARDVAADISNHFELVLSPCTSLETAVVLQPHFPTLNQSFSSLSENLLRRAAASASVQLQLAPLGRIMSLYPSKSTVSGVASGLDTLSSAAQATHASHHKAMIQAIQTGSLVISIQQLPKGGHMAVAYQPVFIANVHANETFGMEQDVTPCDGCTLYNHTSREKWWGAVGAVVHLEPLLLGPGSRLSALSTGESGRIFDYQLVIPSAPAEAGPGPHAGKGQGQGQVLAASVPKLRFSPVSTPVLLPDGQVWMLNVAPASGGWQPAWKAALIAVVVIISFAACSILAALLFSHWQYQQLVWNMLPKEVVRTLQQGKQYAQRFPQVTILFSDIVSYTNMSSEMTPCGLVGLLNSVYSHYDSLCIKHGIFKVETIGDAFMCVAGCPNRCSPEEAAYKMACMARDMIKFTERFVNPPDGRRIRIRVGMYSGDVTAAVVGSSMYHMCLVGDTVNVASRMESNSLPMQCHVGETTARLLTGYKDVHLESRGKLDIKGKGLMETFWLTMPDMDNKPPSKLFLNIAPLPSLCEADGIDDESELSDREEKISAAPAAERARAEEGATSAGQLPDMRLHLVRETGLACISADHMHNQAPAGAAAATAEIAK